jgi:hypothetical protein
MSVNGEAAWLIAYAFDLLAQHLFGGNFSALVDVEASKDEQFHGNSILTRRQPIIGRARPLVAGLALSPLAASETLNPTTSFGIGQSYLG